jgi:hypothetical protein
MRYRVVMGKAFESILSVFFVYDKRFIKRVRIIELVRDGRSICEFTFDDESVCLVFKRAYF